MASIEADDSNLEGRKPPKQLGGMSDLLAIAADLGYSRYRPRPSQEDLKNGDDFVRLLRELNTVQRKVADLNVELQGRKEDMKVGHLTHVSEMEKKIETLARITAILKGFIQNKDRVIARLQQPFPLEFIPVEAEYQKEFSQLLMSAARDYGTLAVSTSDMDWTQNFKDPPSVWAEMLRPIPVALVSCTRYFGAMSAMRESFGTLQKLRWGPSRLPSVYASRRTSPGGSECVTPPSVYASRRTSPGGSECVTPPSSEDLDPKSPKQQGEDDESIADVDDLEETRLSWNSDNENDL